MRDSGKLPSSCRVLGRTLCFEIETLVSGAYRSEGWLQEEGSIFLVLAFLARFCLGSLRFRVFRFW